MNSITLKLQRIRKILWTIGLLMQLSVAQATWIIVKIDNQSDLIFTQAARNNDVEIASISQVLTKSQNSDSNIIYLDGQAFFGSVGGCKIIAQTPDGNQIAIAFFGDPRHRVANGRVRNADLDSRNAAASLKQSMLARVFMVQDGVMKLIGFAGYEDMNQQFALKVTGSAGTYQVELTLS
jgi:hypothetical protein